jgi:hypothetical protein
MTAILHILTQPPDDLVISLLAAQTRQADVQVETVDLTQPDPDYDALVEKIFAADSVEVW